MTDGRLGVGVVGCGLIGRRRAVIARQHEASRVVIVADSNVSRAQEAAQECGAAQTQEWRDVIAHPEVDAVIVATSHDWLAPISIAALESGKDVLCEKPMCRRREEAERVVAAVNASGRQLKIGFNHRYHPAIRRAHDLVHAGAIGNSFFIRCRYGHGGRPGYDREWRMDPALSGGGELLDQGIHAIDLFRWFLGDLSVVAGVTANWYWHAPVEDNVFAIFRSPRGQVASLHASWTQWKNLFCFEVSGELGAIAVNGLGGSYGTESLTLYRRNPAGGCPKEQHVEFPGVDSSWLHEWDDFLEATRSGRPSPPDARDGLAALSLVEDIYAAAAGRMTQ